MITKKPGSTSELLLPDHGDKRVFIFTFKISDRIKQKYTSYPKKNSI